MDRRERAAVEGKWYAHFDESKMLAYVPHEDGACLECGGAADACQCVAFEMVIAIPCLFEVCGTCRGKGSHVNPSIDSCGISPEEFAEDPGFEQDYREGLYDVACYGCGGRRVVPEPDKGGLTAQMREAIEAAEQRQAENLADARTQRMEGGEWG